MKWYADEYKAMEDNVGKINHIVNNRPEYYSAIYYGNQHRSEFIQGKKFSKFINRKLDIKSTKVTEAITLNMNLINPIHKAILYEDDQKTPLGYIQHDYLMQRAYEKFDTFINLQEFEELDYLTVEQQRFPILVDLVFILAKANRFDVISKYFKLHSFDNAFKNDKSGLNLIKNSESLVNAIEFYHRGKWESSVN